MTIKDYLDDLQKLDDKFKWSDGKKYSEGIAECTSIWSNDACRGYLIVAAKQLKLSKIEIGKLLRYLNYAFDCYTQDEAEQVYIKY